MLDSEVKLTNQLAAAQAEIERLDDALVSALKERDAARIALAESIRIATTEKIRAMLDNKPVQSN